MGMWVGRGRKARAAYGFDDIALVPGALTVNPNEVDISWDLCGRRFDIPIIAAAMDGVVGPKLAIEMGRLGGLAVRPAIEPTVESEQGIDMAGQRQQPSQGNQAGHQALQLAAEVDVEQIDFEVALEALTHLGLAVDEVDAAA